MFTFYSKINAIKKETNFKKLASFEIIVMSITY